MSEINWGLLKFKFEVLGASLESIVEEDGISLPLLEHCSKTWKQIPLAKMEKVPLNDLSSFDEIISSLRTNTLSQVQAFQILKDRFLASKYVELESLLLFKTIEIVKNIEVGLPTSARDLKSMTEVLSSLRGDKQNEEENPGKKSTKWEIHIVDSAEK